MTEVSHLDSWIGFGVGTGCKIRHKKCILNAMFMVQLIAYVLHKTQSTQCHEYNFY